MKIFPPRSAAYFIATYFLVLSTFSFGMPPTTDDPNGIDRQDGKQQQQVDQEARARAATDLDGDGSANNDEELRGNDCPAIGENDSADQSKQYRSREDFVACLAADVEKFSEQLTAALSTGEQKDQSKLRERVFLKKIIGTINRLAAKYAVATKEDEAQVMTPSIREMQAKAFSIFSGEEDSYDFSAPWPTKAMTQLETDQEYYEAFKEKEEEALQFLEQDQVDAALYCHGVAAMLDRLSQSQEPDDSDEDDSRFIKIAQQAISLSLVLKSPAEIKTMAKDEKNAELLLFDVAAEIQGKLQNEEKHSSLLSLVQRYRNGDLQGSPNDLCTSYAFLKQQSKKKKAVIRSMGAAPLLEEPSSNGEVFLQASEYLKGVPFDEAAPQPFFFSEIGDKVLVGSLITLYVALLAYELYLDFLPASSQAASS